MEQNLSPAPVLQGQQATAREFLAVVFRRKWLIIGLFLATTATVVLLSSGTKTVYESTGRVLIKRGEKETVFQTTRQVFGAWEEELASEMEIIKSQPVLARARQLAAAQPGPKVAINRAQVSCDVLGKSNAMAIAYTDADPQVARRAAQAVMDAYIEFRQSNMSLAYPKQFFDSEIANVDGELRRLTEQRRDFVEREGIVDIDEQRRTQLALLQAYTQHRSETAAELAEGQAETRFIRELQGRPGIDNPTSGISNPGQDALMVTKARIVEEEARIATMRERYRDDSPEMSAAESTLATLRGMLRRDVEARVEASETHTAALLEKLRSIDKDIATVEGNLASLPNKQLRLDEMDRRISALEQQYKELLSKSGDARITEFTSLPIRVLVLSPPGPAVLVTSRDYVRLGLAPAFSIVVGIGLAFFIDGLDLTVRTAGHAEEVVELPVLATVNERRRRRA